MGLFTNIRNWFRKVTGREEIKPADVVPPPQPVVEPVRSPEPVYETPVIEKDITAPVLQVPEDIPEERIIKEPIQPEYVSSSELDTKDLDKESKRSIQKISAELKFKQTYSDLSKNVIKKEGVIGIKTNPTSNLDEVFGTYQYLLGSKASLQDADVIKALIVGREALAERFTATLHIYNSERNDPIVIDFFGVLAEHTEGINNFLSIGDVIDSPGQYKVIIDAIAADMKNKGSLRDYSLHHQTLPSKQSQITDIQMFYDFA